MKNISINVKRNFFNLKVVEFVRIILKFSLLLKALKNRTNQTARLFIMTYTFLLIHSYLKPTYTVHVNISFLKF